MTSSRDCDPRSAMIRAAYCAYLASVPTERQPDEHGVLSREEVERTPQVMRDLAEQIRAERESAADM